MAPSDLGETNPPDLHQSAPDASQSPVAHIAKRRRRRSNAPGSTLVSTKSAQSGQSLRRKPSRQSSNRALTLFQAKTRFGVFVRGGLIAAAGLGLLFVNALASASVVVALSLLLLRPGIAMVLLAPLSAILTSANPAVFGQVASPALIQAPLLAAPLLLMGYLVVRRNLRPGTLSYVFLGCVSLGGLLSLLTTTSLPTTLDALWKFAVPIAPLIFWLDNRYRSACAAKEAPYALGGAMATIIIGSYFIMMVGAGRELNIIDFQGIFWHPQTLGMMMAAASPLILFATRVPLWLRIVLLIAICILAWMSWTRTALASMAIAGLFAGLATLASQARLRLADAMKRPLQIGQGLAIACLAIGSLIYASTVEEQQYIGTQSRQEVMTEEAYGNARAFALYRAYDNFASRPATGIGFGVPSDPRLIDPDFEAQSIEAFRSAGGSEVLFDKGNSYLAIFEETGFLGAPIWLGLFIFLVVSACATGLAATTAAAIFTLSLFAEATAFSLGGVGMVLWASLILSAGFERKGKSRNRGRANKTLLASIQQLRIQRQRQLHARGFKAGTITPAPNVQEQKTEEQNL